MKVMSDPHATSFAGNYLHETRWRYFTPIKTSYLNVNWAEYTFPSFKVTVINLQLPVQDFDVCQLKMNCVPSNRNTVEPGLTNSSIVSGVPPEQAI